MPSTKRGAGGGVGPVKVGRGTGVIEMSGPVPGDGVGAGPVPGDGVGAGPVPGDGVGAGPVPGDGVGSVIGVGAGGGVGAGDGVGAVIGVGVGWGKTLGTALGIVSPPWDATQKLLNKLKVRCSNDGAERSGHCRNRIQHCQIESWETVICHIRVEAENVLVKSIVEVHEESSRLARTVLILQHCIYCLSVVKFRFKQND